MMVGRPQFAAEGRANSLALAPPVGEAGLRGDEERKGERPWFEVGFF
jgi:hypothetical protein